MKMRILLLIAASISIFIVINFESIIQSEWFLGPKEQRLRCLNMSDEEAVDIVKRALLTKPLGSSVRGNSQDAQMIVVESVDRPATGETSIYLRREDGAVVRAILYPDCVVGWSLRVDTGGAIFN